MLILCILEELTSMNTSFPRISFNKFKWRLDIIYMVVENLILHKSLFKNKTKHALKDRYFRERLCPLNYTACT